MKNFMQIIIHSGPDKEGNHHFTAEWVADNVGPNLNEVGIRGQGFKTNLEEFITRQKAKSITPAIVKENESKAGYVLRDGNWIKLDVHTWKSVE